MPLKELTKRVFLGKSKDPLDPGVFEKLSLVAFLAWVGLGADGLSSSAYGPEEAFLALGGHPNLAVFLALATAATVVLISASYSQIIELFPSGGGGYLVATHLLGEKAGLVSGTALVIDYVLTISTSCAAGVAALCSLVGNVSPATQLLYSLAAVVVLVLLNVRGVRESIQVLLPIFVVFLVTHVVVLVFGLGRHMGDLPQLVQATARDTRSTWAELGAWGALALLLKAFSLGGGTYTGIEAVSNGLQILREPRVRTGRRTMTYMAISLSFMAGALILCYLLAGVRKTEGATLNASLYRVLSGEMLGSGSAAASALVLLCLVSEGALLFVAAQSSFLAGPRVLANMAIDSWVPHRFSLLSERLVTHNGVLLMGGAAVAMLLYAGGSIHILVVMYSINVFLTFTLSQLGMCVHWWKVRRTDRTWLHRFAVNGGGLLVSLTIMVVSALLKFREGAWMTVVITGGMIGFFALIRRHYSSVGLLMKRADDVLTTLPRYKPADTSGVLPKAEPVSRNTPTAVFLVSGFNGLGIHSLLQVQKYFPRYFKNAVFLSVGVVDSANFKGVDEMENLKKETERDLNKYVEFARGLGMHAEHHYAVGTDLLDEIVALCQEVKQKYDRPIFFASKLLFPNENFVTRALHNQTPFAVQRRLQFEGLQTVILPIQVST
ncbi:MAG TPA: APC family permease [Thermoanaerobaculia bacterium]|nr:APC family permease [Thermoanaerobaculia bacterium]HQR67883.1 APC family permease [Thermoanaerobaculia bacterium]